MGFDDNLVTLADFLRGVGFTLYLVLVGQVIYVIRKYLMLAQIERAREIPGAGVLASHITTLSVALLGLGAQAVFVMFTRIGIAPQIPTYTTVLFLGAACYGMYAIMDYERRRLRYHTFAKDDV